MPKTDEKIEVLPFHESIIGLIDRATDDEELRTLGRTIKETEILENHDEIIAAWRKKVKEADWWRDDLEVAKYLFQQKAQKADTEEL